MSSATISLPFTNFNTSPYPPCRFHRTFLNRSTCSQPFDTPSRDYPSATAMSRLARLSRSSTISRGSTVSISFTSGTGWMTSPPLLFLIRQCRSFTFLNFIPIEMPSIPSTGCRNLDRYLMRLSSKAGHRFSYPNSVISLAPWG